MKEAEVTKLWEEYYPKVFGYFFRRVNSRQDTEDLTSLVLASFLEKIMDPQIEIQNPNAYLWKIAHNSLCRFVTQKSKTPISVELDDDFQIKSEEDLEIENTRSDNLKLKLEKLKDCIQQALKPKDVLIIQRIILEDKKSSQIIEEIGLTSVAIRQRLSRALKKLRQKCRQLWFE